MHRIAQNTPAARWLATAIAATAVLAITILPGITRDAPTAYAHPHDDRYDLCTRTPAVTDVILAELRAWGTTNTDTRYDAASGFGCGSGQEAEITAADLLAHTAFTSDADRLELGSSVTTFEASDFAGLNLLYLQFRWSNITEIPARAFDGLELEDLQFRDAPQLEKIHPDAFVGLTVADNRFVINITGQSKLTSETIPPKVFDPLGDQGFANANANLQFMTIYGPKLSHINTRWFASFAKTGTAGWEAFRFAPDAWDNGNFRGGRGIIDTYYYDDGDGRFTDGTKATRGEVSVLSTTTKATLGTAISNEIKRYADAKTGTTFTIGAASGTTSPGTLADATTIRNFAWVDATPADSESPLQVDRTHWGSVDICARTTAVRDAILAELRTNQSAVYGTTANKASGSYSVTTNFGCAGAQNTESAIVTKANLTAHTNWIANTDQLNLESKGITVLRFDDFRYLNATFISLGSNSIEKLPDGIYSGLTPQRLYHWNTGLREFGSNVLHGINATATGAVVLSLSVNNLTDVSIAHDAFDHMPNATLVSLDRNKIGRINTRWFEQLVNLGGTAGWEGVKFWYDGQTPLQDNPTVAHFYNASGGYNDSGATDKVAYDSTNSAHKTALQQAISAKIAAYAAATPSATDTSTLATAGRFSAPTGYGVDPCDRNPAVWKELMRQFNYIRDDIAEDAGTNAWQVTNHDVGDIKHDRYANISLSDCVVLPAQWVSRTTGTAISNQAFPNTVTDKLAIREDGSLSQHRHLRLNGSDLSTLRQSDLANLFAVRYLWMSNANVGDINASLFTDMPQLARLDLSNNKLDTADFTASPNFLAPLNSLSQLNLSGNLLTRFDADWLTSSARSSLSDLNIGNNPIAKTDLTGLDLSELIIAETSIIELDPAISDMSNLETFWWWGLRALPADGVSDFIAALPEDITLSVPDYRLGNPYDTEDADLDNTARDLSLAHLAKLVALDTAGGWDQITHVQIADPCRPTINEAGGADAWANDYGNLCLTSAQRDAAIANIDNLAGGEHFILKNANLSDAQMATLLGKLSGQGLVGAIQFNGNPNAFGDGFNDSALSAFSSFDDLWMLRLRHHDLTYAQASTMLRNLETALASDPRTVTRYGQTINARDGLSTLDLSHNPLLFKTPDSTDPSMMVDVDPNTAPGGQDIHDFLNGIFPRNTFAGFNLNLRATDINFDQLRAVTWSIESGDSPSELWGLRSLDLSDNPNLWKRPDSGSYTDVTATDITELLERLAGIQSIYIGNTGITSDATLKAIFDGLNVAPHTDKTVDPRDTTALERTTAISLSGNNLSAITNLQSSFADFALRNALKSEQLATVELANTSITPALLGNIVDGLATADLLDGVTTLDLSGNSDLFTATGCATGGRTDTVAALIARFTNLRNLDISSSELSFTEFQCAVSGMTAANTVVINARANAGMLTGAAPTAVGTLLAPFRYATTNLVGTGLTASQATEIASMRAQGQSEDERREIERGVTAGLPGLNFMTPLPDETELQSGRGSLRVSFTHNPMYNNEQLTILRYEYRYRVRPTDLTTEWGTTGTEAWRTAAISLDTTGTKTFDIFGLEPETIYQVQLRASSIGQPSILTLTGGTSINLPEINSIKAAITEVNMRAGDQVRLEVDILGLEDEQDNSLYGATGSKLYFTWSDDPSSGSFADPKDQRRVTYTAPALPGTYRVTAEAGPDGVCTSHHESPTGFGISAAAREDCQATITVRVSRAVVDPDPPADPINPAGVIPTSLTDSEGIAYTVFTPVDGGTFTGEGITVTAAKGAIPDRQLLGVTATASATQAPAAVPGASMTIAGGLFDVMGLSADSRPVSGFELDEPLMACLPFPEAFRANISDVVVVERKADSSYGILTSKIRQTAGNLTVCGSVSALPTTIGVAKLGTVPQPPEPPVTDAPDPPETGAAAPSSSTTAVALALGALLLALAAAATAAALSPRRRNHRTTPTHP